MQRLIYYSVAKINFDSAKLESLAKFAAERNTDFNITGYLFFYQDQFVQYLEGPKKAIDQLLLNLKKDSRHEILFFHQKQSAETRLFPSWRMRIISRSFISIEHVLVDHLAWMDKLRSGLKDSHSPSSSGKVSGNLAPETSSEEETVWRMVEKLAALGN